MKKILSILFIGLLALMMVAGCGQKEETETQAPPVEEPTVEQAPELIDTTAVKDSVDAVIEDVKEEVKKEAGH